MSIRLLFQAALVAQLSFSALAVNAASCEDKEYWFEAGVGFYANGYRLEGTEKRIKSLYRKMKGEPITEDEAVAIGLDAWRFLDANNASRDIDQIKRLMLVEQYYARCLEAETMNEEVKSAP